MSDSINLFESYLEIYEGKPVAAPADEPDPFGRPGGKYGGVKKGGGYDNGWQAIQRKNAAKKEMREDRSGPKPTYLPKSRERDIGRHDDWKDKPLEWGQRPEKAQKLRRRAAAVIGTQRRQDREVSFYEGNRFEREYNVPNWDKVYDRNTRDYGTTLQNRKRTKSGKMETPNQTTQRLGKQRVSDHKSTRGVKQIKGGKGVQMYFGRNVFTKEDLEYILDYLISEGYADTYDCAISILESMSDEWREDIIDEANALDRGKDSLTKNIDRQYRDKPLRKTSSGAFLRRGVKIRGAKDHKPRNPHYGKYYDMQSKKRSGASYRYLANLDHTQD